MKNEEVRRTVNGMVAMVREKIDLVDRMTNKARPDLKTFDKKVAIKNVREARMTMALLTQWLAELEE